MPGLFGMNIFITVLVIGGILLASGIKIMNEYERAVIFRLGRMVDARGPGIIYVIPLIERMQRMDLRTVTRRGRSRRSWPPGFARRESTCARPGWCRRGSAPSRFRPSSRWSSMPVAPCWASRASCGARGTPGTTMVSFGRSARRAHCRRRPRPERGPS